MIDGRSTRWQILQDVNNIAAGFLHIFLIFRFTLGRRRRHQFQLLLVLLVTAVLGQFFDNVRTRQRCYLDIMRKRDTICRRTWERMFLAAIGIGVDERENRIKISFTSLAKSIDKICIVHWKYGQMIAGFVAHLRSLQVKLDVHARPIARLVQLTIDNDWREIWILCIKWRPLISQRVQARNFTGVYSVLCHFGLLEQSILSHQDILAGALNAEEVAHGWPKAILPRDEVIFNARIWLDK